MVERAPDYRVTFKTMPILGNMAPFLDTDVTNPRELYSMLSDNKQQGALLTSVKFNPQAGAKLPPLHASTDEQGQWRAIDKRPQHGSYPDLISLRKPQDARADQDSIRRSASLQDVRSADPVDSLAQGKKLKPILRAGENRTAIEHQDRGGVKFGNREVHLIKERPLPPIEPANDSSQPRHCSSSTAGPGAKGREESRMSFSFRPHRRHGPEFPSELFPRGQPTEVKKPLTPTYDDYPEAYWELRSPTVQDPSDLKEDMINRDRYRLQQISSLRLRAMNRELVVNRLDSLRKWQQQILESSCGPTKQQETGHGSVTPANTSARSEKQQRIMMPVRNHSLAVAALSISPAIKKQTGAKVSDPDGAGEGLQQRHKADIPTGTEPGSQDLGVKPVKAAVVNLCIDPDGPSHTPTSDVYNGIRRIMVGTRPLSLKNRTQVCGHSQDPHLAPSPGQLHGQALTAPPRSISGMSINATVGSSQSLRLQRVPSAPAGTPSGSASGTANVGDSSDTDTNTASKKILKKFKRLEVFSEKQDPADSTVPEPWDLVQATSADKRPYLPQNRPPTYKLDTRHYPPRHNGSATRAEPHFMGVIMEGYSGPGQPYDGGKVPLTARSSEKSEATALSFRFNNGEVVVSRQGKRPC